jgi:serine protease AprX
VTIEIPRSLVEFILLGPTDDRRQLQDSPVLGDVWIEFAKRPNARLDLLITPYRDLASGKVASAIAGRLALADAAGEAQNSEGERREAGGRAEGSEDSEAADVAYLQGVIAARLSFEEVLRVIVPMTYWWSEKRIQKSIAIYVNAPEELRKDIEEIIRTARDWLAGRADLRMRDVAPFDRYVVLAGLVLWAQDNTLSADSTSLTAKEQTKQILDAVAPKVDNIVDRIGALFETIKRLEPAEESAARKPLIWHVSLNRVATPALEKSIPAVKADAARTLFRVNCSQIGWAVIDSGIDDGHWAFRDDAGRESRVRKSFDFSNIRKIVSLDNLRSSLRQKRISDLLARADLFKAPTPQDADEALEQLAMDAKKGRPTDWELVEGFLRLKPETKPFSNHGTHVAGIIGASRKGARKTAEFVAQANASGQGTASKGVPATSSASPGPEPSQGNSSDEEDSDGHAADGEGQDFADGMCPDIALYDFRVLGSTIKETEFAIIAVLQYIRHLNERNSFMTIHGANLSLSIPHDVRNFACGRTPVCNECERLVDSGVAVVAAAGNRGYHSFETKEGSFESYAAFSVTDPGNADGVITVGATHRYWPHTYGVSFFSSRGPTGDGRLKPDLVAPGERIRAPVPGNEWADLDGTSMAAPHVSGAAAMLMARYSELIGQPRRVKKILCDSATDLGRERSFQGYGMLDVLRAFQSI